MAQSFGTYQRKSFEISTQANQRHDHSQAHSSFMPSGKSEKKIFSSSFKPASFPDEIFHSEVCGPLPVTDEGENYIATFQDQFTCIFFAAGMAKNTGEIFETLKKNALVKK